MLLIIGIGTSVITDVESIVVVVVFNCSSRLFTSPCRVRGRLWRWVVFYLGMPPPPADDRHEAKALATVFLRESTLPNSGRHGEHTDGRSEGSY